LDPREICFGEGWGWDGVGVVEAKAVGTEIVNAFKYLLEIDEKV
jgi:hypothetical protein